MKRRCFSLIEALEVRIAPAAIANINLNSLNGTNGFKLSGKAAKDAAGWDVGAAGDVNGDGFEDIIIGGNGEYYGIDNRGAAYIVFGKAGGFPANFSLGKLNGTNGFKLVTSTATDGLGYSVNGIGDINGDGIDDLAVGASHTTGTQRRGELYVVFGKANGFGPAVNVSTMAASEGFKILSEFTDTSLGGSVSAAGDINNDGIGDLIVGDARRSGGANLESAGAAYVIFGRTTGFGTALSLGSLNGTDGFRFVGTTRIAEIGYDVSRAGDVNGDGIDDVLIGAYRANVPSGNKGAAYVIFGKETPFNAELVPTSLTGTNGFRIAPENLPSVALTGYSVDGGGDINGDGFADLVILAITSITPGYVIFGRQTFPATFDLSSLDGTNGFKLSLSGNSDIPSTAEGNISILRDFNGDGFSDIMLSNFSNTTSLKGVTHVLFGKASGFQSVISLNALDGTNGFSLFGTATNEESGRSSSSAGDINGDGFTDLIIGAPGARGMAGAAYVIFGNGKATLAKGAKSATYTDVDGDLITVKTTKGAFSRADFVFADDGSLKTLDLTRMSFEKSAITITAKKPKLGNGDGRVAVGFVDATGVDLASVSVLGNLGRIVAGNGDRGTAALGKLAVDSLGGAAADSPLVSVFQGAVGTLKINKDLQNAAIHISGAPSPINQNKAVALKGLTVNGNVVNAFVGVGFDAGGHGINAAVAVNNVSVKGSWMASSLAVGIDDLTGDGFGRNDATIGSGSSILAKIASLTIKGTVAGSSSPTNDHFGIVAEMIAKATISGVRQSLINNADYLLDATNNDFRLVELGA